MLLASKAQKGEILLLSAGLSPWQQNTKSFIVFDEGERILIRSFLSSMPSDFRIGLDRQVPRHHATVRGIATSLCSAENRLQAQISNSMCFLRKTNDQKDKF